MRHIIIYSFLIGVRRVTCSFALFGRRRAAPPLAAWQLVGWWRLSADDELYLKSNMTTLGLISPHNLSDLSSVLHGHHCVFELPLTHPTEAAMRFKRITIFHSVAEFHGKLNVKGKPQCLHLRLLPEFSLLLL